MEIETVPQIGNSDEAKIVIAPKTKAELLLEKIKALATGRYVTSGLKAKVDELDGRWKALKAVIQNSVEYKQVTEDLKFFQAADGDLDAEIRSLAVDLYQESGEKKVVAGVEIKLFQTSSVSYDVNQVRQWALAKMPNFLTLDTAKFEEWAKAIGKVTPELLPDGVSVYQMPEPRAQIATKLPVEYLPEELRGEAG